MTVLEPPKVTITDFHNNWCHNKRVALYCQKCQTVSPNWESAQSGLITALTAVLQPPTARLPFAVAVVAMLLGAAAMLARSRSVDVAMERARLAGPRNLKN